MSLYLQPLQIPRQNLISLYAPSKVIDFLTDERHVLLFGCISYHYSHALASDTIPVYIAWASCEAVVAIARYMVDERALRIFFNRKCHKSSLTDMEC